MASLAAKRQKGSMIMNTTNPILTMMNPISTSSIDLAETRRRIKEKQEEIVFDILDTKTTSLLGAEIFSLLYDNLSPEIRKKVTYNTLRPVLKRLESKGKIISAAINNRRYYSTIVEPEINETEISTFPPPQDMKPIKSPDYIPLRIKEEEILIERLVDTEKALSFQELAKKTMFITPTIVFYTPDNTKPLKNALKRLENKGKIISIMVGNKRFYSAPVNGSKKKILAYMKPIIDPISIIDTLANSEYSLTAKDIQYRLPDFYSITKIKDACFRLVNNGQISFYVMEDETYYWKN